jgi:predicted outer membrane protein
MYKPIVIAAGVVIALSAIGASAAAKLTDPQIAHAQNAELKSLLESGLKLFQDHERDAENLAKQLKAAP